VSSVSVLKVTLHNNSDLINAVPFIMVSLELCVASPVILQLFEVFCDMHC
jgi:hypothetical protein